MSPIEYCISKAKEITYVKGKARHFSAVFDKRGRVVSSGANNYLKTSTIMHKASRKIGLCKDYLHSEINALTRDKKRRGVKLVVVRIDAKGEPCYSAPCPVCASVIKNFPNIVSVEFSV